MLLVFLELQKKWVFLLEDHVSFPSILIDKFLVVLQLYFELVDDLRPLSDFLFAIPPGIIYDGALRHAGLLELCDFGDFVSYFIPKLGNLAISGGDIGSQLVYFIYVCIYLAIFLLFQVFQAELELFEEIPFFLLEQFDGCLVLFDSFLVAQLEANLWFD